MITCTQQPVTLSMSTVICSKGIYAHVHVSILFNTFLLSLPSQAYLAEFTFTIAKVTPLPEKYKAYMEHEPTAQALVIADIMVRVLQEDMKAMVSQDVRKDIVNIST